MARVGGPTARVLRKLESAPPSQLEICQLCMAAKQSLNVSKESVKAAEIEPESEGLNYRRVRELPELD